MIRVVALAGLAVVLSGCGSWRRTASAIPADRPPVAVRLDGPALADAAAREAAVAAIGRVTQRRVELVDDAATAAMLESLATRTKRERAGTRRYDWREPRCAKHVDALVAARFGAEGVYRVRLQPAAGPAPERGLFDTFRSTAAPVAGEVSVRVVDGSGAVSRAAADGTSVADAVTAAVARLPGLPPPQWQRVANGLVKAGCPFLALAVQDLQLRDGKAGRVVRERALLAMTGAVERRAAPTSPAVVPAAEPPQAAPVPRLSCEALCGMHVVELCNSDRSLWSQHLVSWQRSGCGSRRSEDFLVDCYRRQRISGTFQDACVRPCEASPEGRQALLSRLQMAGCVRPGTS